MISSDVPTITKANWPTLNASGWRFECDLDINDNNAVIKLRNLQIRCGKNNVAPGHSFPEDKTEPQPKSDILGIYIKDIDDIASTMIAALDDEDKLAAWLSN